MNSNDNETVISVEGEVMPESSTGKIAEDMVLISMRRMNDDEKFELLKQATKIINAKNKKMRALIKGIRIRIKTPTMG